MLVRSCKSMNNLLSYFGLTDPRMSASDTDLPLVDTVLMRWNSLYFATLSDSKNDKKENSDFGENIKGLKTVFKFILP